MTDNNGDELFDENGETTNTFLNCCLAECGVRGRADDDEVIVADIFLSFCKSTSTMGRRMNSLLQGIEFELNFAHPRTRKPFRCPKKVWRAYTKKCLTAKVLVKSYWCDEVGLVDVRNGEKVSGGVTSAYEEKVKTKILPNFNEQLVELDLVMREAVEEGELRENVYKELTEQLGRDRELINDFVDEMEFFGKTEKLMFRAIGSLTPCGKIDEANFGYDTEKGILGLYGQGLWGGK